MEWWSIPKAVSDDEDGAQEQAEGFEQKDETEMSPQEQEKMKKIRELVTKKLLTAPAFDENTVGATVDQIMKLPKRQIQALLQNPLPEVLTKPKEDNPEVSESEAGHLDESEVDIVAEDEENDETEVDEEADGAENDVDDTEVDETENDADDTEVDDSEVDISAEVEESEKDDEDNEIEENEKDEDDDASAASAEVSRSSSSSSSSSEAPSSSDDGFQKVIAIPNTLDRPHTSPANIAEMEENEDKSCPICLADPDTMARGPCGHSFCVPCMERVVNAYGEETRWPPLSVSDAHLDAPTLGRCPICRTSLSLFEISLRETGELLHPPDKKYYERSDFPLKHQVYHPYRGKIGQLSFHWDWARLKNKKTENTPFLNIYRSIQSHPERWVLANGEMAQKVVFFEPDSCHFHMPSRTFHGKIKWPSRLRGAYEWDVVLGFHSSYRFLSGGRVYMKRDWPSALTPSSVKKLEKEQQELAGYPLDGRWTVTWRKKKRHPLDKNGELQTMDITVASNAYVQGAYTFYLDFSDDPNTPKIAWPKSDHYQRALLGYIDFDNVPLGVEVGHKIVWETTSQHFEELIWTRQTIGKIPIPRVIVFGSGQDKMLYQQYQEDGSDVSTGIPKYNGTSLWGNVFCKRLYTGSASYHFLSPENSYVSYEHPSCSSLPSLDDDTPLPTRVKFTNMTFDSEERKLNARVEWEEQFGTSWNDNVRWKLEMWFDSEYMVILKGGIQCEWSQERRARPRPPTRPNPNRPTPVPIYVPPPEEEEKEEEAKEEEAKTETEEPQRNEEWIMSGYGHDQVYINAAVLERFRPPGQADLSMNWKGISETQLERLKQEGATERSMKFVEHVFQLAASDPSSNPIDFML